MSDPAVVLAAIHAGVVPLDLLRVGRIAALAAVKQPQNQKGGFR